MSDSSLKSLSTVDGVLEALGGGTAAARLAACTPQNLTNALRRGRLPASTFLIFSDELERRGFRAPAELWGIKPAAPQGAAGPKTLKLTRGQ
jgi:hypothetical protein